MAIPTRRQLNNEVDRQFRERYPDAPDSLDRNNPRHARFITAWLELRDDVLNEWTDNVFHEFFPAVGSLDRNDPSQAEFIDYWTDIRHQILEDAPPKFNWDSYSGSKADSGEAHAVPDNGDGVHGVAPQGDFAPNIEDIAEPEPSVAEEIRKILEGVHGIETVGEAAAILAKAEALELGLQATGGFLTVVLAGWEVLDSFETGERIANAMGVCYGVMFEIKDMPDADLVRPDWPITDSEWNDELDAWREGLAVGRRRGRDTKNRNHLLLAIAKEAQESPDQAEWAVLNAMWQHIRPQLRAGEYTAEWLDWPTPRPYR